MSRPAVPDIVLTAGEWYDRSNGLIPASHHHNWGEEHAGCSPDDENIFVYDASWSHDEWNNIGIVVDNPTKGYTHRRVYLTGLPKKVGEVELVLQAVCHQTSRLGGDPTGVPVKVRVQGKDQAVDLEFGFLGHTHTHNHDSRYAPGSVVERMGKHLADISPIASEPNLQSLYFTKRQWLLGPSLDASSAETAEALILTALAHNSAQRRYRRGGGKEAAQEVVAHGMSLINSVGVKNAPEWYAGNDRIEGMVYEAALSEGQEVSIEARNPVPEGGRTAPLGVIGYDAVAVPSGMKVVLDGDRLTFSQEGMPAGRGPVLITARNDAGPSVLALAITIPDKEAGDGA